MGLNFTKIILTLTVAGIVSACSHINDNSPDKMVRAGVQQMILKDNRLNFSGSFQGEYHINSNTNNENEISSDTSEIIKTNETHNKLLNTSSKPLPQTEADDDDGDNEPKQKNSLAPFFEQFSQSFSVPFTGAIDIRKGQMEIIPEVRYENKNVLVSFKFPTYIDFKNLSLYTDVSAITHLLDKIPHTRMVIGDKYLQLAVPKSQIKNMPLSDLLKSLPKSIDDGYAAIEPDAFKKVNVDEYGKTLKAKYQVNLNVDYALMQKIDNTMLESLSKALKEAADKADQNSKYKPEDYAALQNIIDEFTSTFNSYFFDGHDSDDSGVFKNPYFGVIKQFKNNQNSIQYNYYFDLKGRIIGIREQLAFPKEVESIDGTVKIDTKIHLKYTTNPKFTMQPPTPQNSINIMSRPEFN
ncbi:Neuroendocrine-specific golgi family protein [Snodgrassella alvi SCGC AB-598-P14]|nr:Neuroendocrine-specific golgi family protein [Snodgrassella alvi SCGC AB-598-P14]